MTAIDLNCDLGELPESIRDRTDAALMSYVTSANVACGGHAGDVATMEHTVLEAVRRGVAIGAHPAYPDRDGFGRRETAASPDEVEEFVFTQVAALRDVAARLGARLAHVKPHGALYHAASRDHAIARAVARAAARVSPDLVLVGMAGSPALRTWRSMGARAAGEGFADRRYDPDGRLRSRAHSDALISDPAEAAIQAVRIANNGEVIASGAFRLPIRAETICVHGDTPGAVEIARAVREALDRAGVRVVALA